MQFDPMLNTDYVYTFLPVQENHMKRKFFSRHRHKMSHTRTFFYTVICELPSMRLNILIKRSNRSRILKNKINFHGICH